MTSFKNSWISLCFGVVICTSWAQSTATSNTALCPSAANLANAHWFGKWQVQIEQNGQTIAVGSLDFKQNPEFVDSLAGELMLGTQSSQVFGDMEADRLELEETENGKDATALWLGQVAPGSCNQAIIGTRRMRRDGAAESAKLQNFVLRRSGW